ncbi:MAG: histidine--tRNA ligase [Gemmatimonadales bacterium]
MSHQALPGFRDFFPDELAIRNHVFSAMRRVAGRYGFEEYDGPPLEGLELYTQKSGDEIVGQLYHFVDKGGREVALRPEMTPTLARMVATRLNGLKKPVRWFSIPQLFRYERQQRGRLREHFQLNCDLIGEPGPLADAEIIALAIDVMRELGLGATDVRVRLSDRRLLGAILDSLDLGGPRAPLAFQALDKLGRSEYAPRRAALLEAGADAASLARLEGLGAITEWAALEREFPGAVEVAAPFRATLDALEAMGLGGFLDLDLTIVRGLAYYTGTVFELFDAERKLRAICGGGRYDGLLAALGGVDSPALGFGMGDVVLTELLRDRGLLPETPAVVDVFVAIVTPAERPPAFAAAHALRDAGYRVEFAMGESAVGKQLKLAAARRARVAIVIGPTTSPAARPWSRTSWRAPSRRALAELVAVVGLDARPGRRLSSTTV